MLNPIMMRKIMTDFFSKYDIDQTVAEEAGVPVDFGNGVKISVRRSTCEKAVNTYKSLMQPYKAWREGTIPLEVSKRIAAQVAARAIVSGWEGMPDPDNKGAKLPYSVENAEALFIRFPDLVSDVMTAADSSDIFTKEALEAVRKN